MQTELKKLSETKLDKNTVIVRANLDIRLENGEIVDDTKIKALIPTLNYLQKTNCKTIILAHIGTDCSEYNDELSMIPVRFAIGRLLNKPIKFVSIDNCQNSIKFMEFGDILLLENLCFSKEEFSGNDTKREEFIKNIAQFAQFHVDESFGLSSKLSSVKFLPKLLETVIGLNYEEELKAADTLSNRNKDNFVSLIGGEIKDAKFKMLKKLIKKSEKVLLGGEIGALFLSANGVKNGGFSTENITLAKELIKLAKENSTELVLPKDVVTSEGKKLDAAHINSKDVIFDIGSKTSKEFQKIIENAKTLVANGTMGKSEESKFKSGTNDVFEILALLSVKDCYKVVGGESTTEVIHGLSIKHKKFNHISTGIFELVNLL